MKKTVFVICFLSSVFASIWFSSCAADNPNRVYFKINPHDRKIEVPVQLNDSITANLDFDAGSSLILDSTFCAIHPSITLNNSPISKKLEGSSWASQHTPSSEYKVGSKIKIGNADLRYDHFKIWNWKSYMSSSDGMFNIPKEDTTNVWELNFENNYMEIHPAVSFKMPENCFVVPMVSPYDIIIQLPLKIKCADGDTLTLNRPFYIDTGMSWDIALMCRAGELPFFNKKEAVWTECLSTYMRHYTVNAMIFDHLSLDSLRIYTFDYPNGVNSNYLIGQNFLKRFNVFFDMKNRQVGFQPIKNFQRVVNPGYWRFHYSTYKNSKGRYIVKYVADYKGNYYRTAGLKVGDEIVAVNGKPYKNISYLEEGDFYKQNKLLFDIIRKGRPMKIVVQVDKNEKQGD
jgi:hypothetical protein